MEVQQNIFESGNITHLLYRVGSLLCLHIENSSKVLFWFQVYCTYFVSDSYKKNALSRTDHCTWYLSTSVRRSIQVGGPGYGSYWGSMAAQRSSQQWSRHYTPEWWRMLVLEVKSRNHSVSQMGSSKVVYWLPRSSPSYYQQCSTRLGGWRLHMARQGGWRLHTVQTERWPIQRRTLQSEDQDYSDTDERAAIRRWQCTGCPLCWRDSENSGCFLRCVKEVWPED